MVWKCSNLIARGERIVFWWPNTNTNIIRLFKNDRIRIRILFGLKKATEYEYEYYSVWKKQPNTNTNIIRFEKIDRIRIRILFGLNISTEYEYEYYLAIYLCSVYIQENKWDWREYYLAWKITRIQIRILVFGLNYSNNIRIQNYLLTSVPYEYWYLSLSLSLYLSLSLLLSKNDK